MSSLGVSLCMGAHAILLVLCTSGCAPQEGIEAAYGKELLEVLPTARHDFQSVKQGQVLIHTFALKNMGAVSIEIAEIDRSCGCTEVECSPMTILPGQSAMCRVEIHDTDSRVGPSDFKVVLRSKRSGLVPVATLSLDAFIGGPLLLRAIPERLHIGIASSIAGNDSVVFGVVATYPSNLAQFVPMEWQYDTTGPYDIQLPPTPVITEKRAGYSEALYEGRIARIKGGVPSVVAETIQACRIVGSSGGRTASMTLLVENARLASAPSAGVDIYLGSVSANKALRRVVAAPTPSWCIGEALVSVGLPDAFSTLSFRMIDGPDREHIEMTAVPRSGPRLIYEVVETRCRSCEPINARIVGYVK